MVLTYGWFYYVVNTIEASETLAEHKGNFCKKKGLGISPKKRAKAQANVIEP